jgi:hypothetical protein
VFSLCSNQDLNGFPTCSSRVPLVPSCTHILCPKFNSLWPSWKAEDYNISILGCPKLDFFGWWAHHKRKILNFGSPLLINKSEYIYIPTTYPLKKGY